jgi:membrane peptidoglycan carboxypeptidase
MYKSAIAEVSVVDKFTEIQESENFMSLDDVPEIFTNAVIAAEDKRFYIHNGIDIFSIGRAIKTNLKTQELTEGGSTITQQIAKNLYFTQSKHFSRKIAEMFVARNIEKNYSKDDILEIYININFYGSGYYGIYEASQGYFEKDPIDLTDYEATLLAGVPNAPSVYSPKVNLNLAERRQDVVLQKMIEAGYLTEDEKTEIQEEQVTK